MSHSANTRSDSTPYNKTIAIVPPITPTYPTSPYLTKYLLENIHTSIKTSNNKHHSDMKAMNNYIYDMNDYIYAMIKNILIQVPRQTSNKKNSQIFYVNSHLMKNIRIK